MQDPQPNETNDLAMDVTNSLILQTKYVGVLKFMQRLV